MNRIDNAAVARIWQRVHPQEENIPIAALNDILYRERQIAATYAYLLHRENKLLRNLYLQKRTAIACIKGLYALLGYTAPQPTPAQHFKGTIEAVLRRCYAQQLVCIRLYEEYSAHPECGHAFSLLVQQARQDSKSLLALLGTFPKR